MNLKIISLESFARDVKRLYKKYKQINKDLNVLQKVLEENPISSIHLGHSCYKIRLANSSIPTGKSGGFRIIYYYLDRDSNLYLMAIYSKTELENISDERVLEILKNNGFN